jgi:hypothetical protein
MGFTRFVILVGIALFSENLEGTRRSKALAVR